MDEASGASDVFRHPTAGRILAVARRDLAQVIAPALSDPRAQLTVSVIDAFLRHLIVRDQDWPRLLGELAPAYQALTGEAFDAEGFAPALEVRIGERSAADLTTRPGGSTIADAPTLSAIHAEDGWIDACVRLEEGLGHPDWTAQQAEALAVTPERLAAYLTGRVGRGPVTVTRADKAVGGFSKETYVVELVSEAGPASVVFRIGGPYGPVATTVEEEFVLLDSLHRAGLRVPKPLMLETDPGVIGRSFIVFEKASGVTVPHTVGLTLEPRHAKSALQLAEVLASLHSLDIAALKLPVSWRNGAVSIRDCLVDQVDYWEAEWERYRIEPSPTLAAAFAWLRRNIPDNPAPARIVHGDAGLHNALVADDRITAMLDWELAHIGDPAEDLKYCRIWTDQVVPWAEFKQRYHACGGPEFDLSNDAFYSVLYDVRTRVMSARSVHGFMVAERPELLWLFGALKYGRMFNSTISRIIAGEA